MKTLKCLAALLSYPTGELVEACPTITGILEKEKWVANKNIKAIEKLVSALQGMSLLEAQEEYVALFDRTPSLSLHMFEHIHGDSRERGQAMVDLSQMYHEEGLQISGNETPDYLPMFLEYLSVLDPSEASKCIDETVDVLAAITKRLDNRESPYASVFAAIASLSKRAPNKKALKEAMEAADGSAATEEEIDATWEEQSAFDNTGQQAASCSMQQPPEMDKKVKIVFEEGQL